MFSSKCCSQPLLYLWWRSWVWVQELCWGCSWIPTSVSSGNKTQLMEGCNNHNEGLTSTTSTPVGPDQPQSPGPSLIRDLEDGMARVETKKLKLLLSDDCIPSLSTTLLTRVFIYSPRKWYNASSKMSETDWIWLDLQLSNLLKCKKVKSILKNSQ